MLVPEADLERQVILYIADIKARYSEEWREPSALAKAFGIDLKIDRRGASEHLEGVAVDNLVFLDPTGTLQRQLFTAYHEITHHLIRRNDALLSILHEQYPSEVAFERIVERLSNVGAAEFLIPRSMVLHECQQHGYSVTIIKTLCANTKASASAACVQLALCAPHQCVAIVARKKDVVPAAQTVLVPTPSARIVVDIAVCSRTMRYCPARNTIVPPGHLIHVAFAGPEADLVKGNAQIPFRRATPWATECEAIRLGGQVFALFHVESPPQQNSNQISLYLTDRN